METAAVRANNLFSLIKPKTRPNLINCIRSFAADTKSKLSLEGEIGLQKDEVSKVERSDSSPGWLSRLLVRSIDTGHVSQSSLMSNKDTVYELQFHAVKPEFMDQYLHDFCILTELAESLKSGGKLVGSWTVEVGDLDEAVHLWQFEGGYPSLTQHKNLLSTNKDIADISKQKRKYLRSQKNQVLLSFSFWPAPKPRDSGNIYELRSYVLKPGTVIEWGNSWARGIRYRNYQNEAVAGFFSQIGDQNNIHHLWSYRSLQDRKEARESAWRIPGWDSCVSDTVPLVRHMTSRILIPTSFSPMQ